MSRSQPDVIRLRQLRRTFLVMAILRSRGGTSIKTLARECGVCERTTRRDLIALEAAGFPIFTVGEWGAKLYRFPRGIDPVSNLRQSGDGNEPPAARFEGQRMSRWSEADLARHDARRSISPDEKRARRRLHAKSIGRAYLERGKYRACHEVK